MLFGPCGERLATSSSTADHVHSKFRAPDDAFRKQEFVTPANVRSGVLGQLHNRHGGAADIPRGRAADSAAAGAVAGAGRAQPGALRGVRGPQQVRNSVSGSS